MPDRRLLVLALLAPALAACPKKSDEPKGAPARVTDGGVASAIDAAPRTADGTPILPPAPPVPAPPAGLPPLPEGFAPTPEEVALGALLFHDPRLGADGTTACATCHDPRRDHSGSVAHAQTAAGKPNLRRAPALSNLAWSRELGWDGRSSDAAAFLRSHATGQLGQSLDDGIVKLGASPTYRAHLARTGAGRGHGETATAALVAYVRTRFDGDAPWDRHEAGVAGAVPDDVVAGYQLFTGKALCGSCHPPPLYTDHGFHRLGLIGSPDDGRGRVDPAQAGAFKTPGLRGASRRGPLFHDGSAVDLDASIDWHLAGGRGQGAGAAVIDPGLEPVDLAAAERAQLGAFVRALTGAAPVPARPVLPEDLP